MNGWRRFVPEPALSTALLLLWLALARSLGPGEVLLGLGLALALPPLTARLRAQAIVVRRPWLLARFVLTVIGDVIASNFAVGWGVLRWRARPARSRFVQVPLELRSPTGLAALALVTTIVPGTVFSELAADSSALLLHVWDVDDEARFVARFKARYEQPLREIFP